MSEHIEITQQFLNERFEYVDGFLFKKGKKVGTCPDKNGYGRLTIRLNGRKFYFRTHRVIFLYHNGYLPEIIDHINGDVSDNRIENLRPATRSQNQWNRRNDVRSATGRRGVILVNNRFRAVCKVNNKSYFLGSFDTLDEAEKELMRFRKEHHMEFANND